MKVPMGMRSSEIRYTHTARLAATQHVVNLTYKSEGYWIIE